MLKTISWQDYGLFIVIAVCGYYITIGFLYYLSDIKLLLSGKSYFFGKGNSLNNLFHSKKSEVITNNKDYSDMPPENGDNLFSSVNEFVHEIKVVLSASVADNIVKQEVLYSLQRIAKRFPLIKETPFKTVISNYIFLECATCCSIHLDEDEMNIIWLS